ncbi:fimbrial protein [Proteus mirabilis]|uniref:fimbrial protein n=1 Tax=Proteus mirabilis TaxID=584 RepID=UPI0034D4BCCB
MKKSLFSLLILSMLSLSTQAIATNHDLGSKTITITGKVLKRVPSCTIREIEPIELGDIYDDMIGTLHPIAIGIRFSDCSNLGLARTVNLVLKPQNQPYLENTIKNGTNAVVKITDLYNNREIDLSDKTDRALLFTSSIDENNDAYFLFGAEFVKPTSVAKVTAGEFNASLTFDAFIDDMLPE